MIPEHQDWQDVEKKKFLYEERLDELSEFDNFEIDIKFDKEKLKKNENFINERKIQRRRNTKSNSGRRDSDNPGRDWY